jgi:phosphatidylglycerophosphate synthase
MTLFRLGIAIYSGLIALTGASTMVFVGILSIMVLDYYDGVLFDKSYLATQPKWRISRRILDATVDRVAIQLICIPIAILHPAFFWIYVAILIRELALTVYTGNQFNKRVLVYPGPTAKVACAFVGIATIAFLMAPGVVSTIATALMLALSVLSLREYVSKVESHRHTNRQQEVGIVEVF